jgi:hypothetical protein
VHLFLTFHFVVSNFYRSLSPFASLLPSSILPPFFYPLIYFFPSLFLFLSPPLENAWTTDSVMSEHTGAAAAAAKQNQLTKKKTGFCTQEFF